jgi:hypothetical protein
VDASGGGLMTATPASSFSFLASAEPILTRGGSGGAASGVRVATLSVCGLS